MPCYYPLKGYKGHKRTENGKRKIVFKIADAYNDMPIQVPCGQCIGCRLDRSRDWAIRIVHEASLHDENSFITLTYNEEHVPKTGTLVKEHFRNFMKRLRKKYKERKIRFFHCGEYGDQHGRPHYHAILFGLDFPDKEFHSVNFNNDPVYRSPSLEKLWKFGFSTIGAVTLQSASYVARYVTKKLNGKAIEQGAYDTNHIDQETGEILQLQSEYCTMSRRPGVAKDWYDQYKSDCYPKDFITHKGIKLKPPKYYDRLFEENHPKEMQRIKNKRLVNHKKHEKDNTDERLEAREAVKQAQFKMLKRGAENA